MTEAKEETDRPTLNDAITSRRYGDLSRALDIHRELMKKSKNKRDPSLLAEHGAVHYLYRSLVYAEKYLKRSLKYGKVCTAYKYLAIMANEEDKLDEAEALIEQAMELATEWDWERLFVHGLIKLRLGRIDAARDILKDTLDEVEGTYLTPRMRSARIRLGHALNRNPPDWLRIGVLYDDLGRRQEALHAFRVATKVTPENPDAWIFLAETVAVQEEFDDVVMNGRMHAPNNVTLRLYEAKSFYDFGMKFEALNLLETIPGPEAEEWVEKITVEFDEMLEYGDYNPYLGEYGAIIRDEEYYDDYS